MRSAAAIAWIAAVLMLAACGGGSDDGGGGGGNGGSFDGGNGGGGGAGGDVGDPAEPPSADVERLQPTYAGLDSYDRRCRRINQRGAQAQVVWEATKRMKLGDSETVAAAVTLDQSVPPEKVLPRTDASGEPGIVVSCRLQAMLMGSPDEFDITDTDWTNRSVYETDTARWVWGVTPKTGGDHTLTLLMRPIVRQRQDDGPSDTLVAADANIRDYTTRVHVSVPWNRRPEALMTQIASTLNIAEGLVKAMTALIVAICALLAATKGVRHWRGRSGDSGKRPPRTSPR